MMLRQVYRWFGPTIGRACGNYARWCGRTELANLNDHLLADIGCSQSSTERAAEQKVRNRTMQVPPF